MLMPQIILLMPLYAILVGGDLVAKESRGRHVADDSVAADFPRPVAAGEVGCRNHVRGGAGAGAGVTALGFAGCCFPGKACSSLRRAWRSVSCHAGEGLGALCLRALFLVVNASAILSVAFMFSCFNMKPAAATIVALSYLFVNLVMESIPFFDRFDNWFITHHFRCWLLVFQNPVPWAQILQSQVAAARPFARRRSSSVHGVSRARHQVVGSAATPRGWAAIHLAPGRQICLVWPLRPQTVYPGNQRSPSTRCSVSKIKAPQVMVFLTV